LYKSAKTGLLLVDDSQWNAKQERIMSQFELDERTRVLLDRVRHSTATLSVYEMPPDLAEAAVWEIGKIVLEDRHLPLVQYNTYRWYLREMSKLLRIKTGWSLALELEICLRKWVAYQLDLGLLQVLLCECCDRIGAMTPGEVEEKVEVKVEAGLGATNE
jgi:hypothetical protein